MEVAASQDDREVNAVRGLLRLFHLVYGDYVDDVWGRDYQFVADALGIPLNDLHEVAYRDDSRADYKVFIDNLDKRLDELNEQSRSAPRSGDS